MELDILRTCSMYTCIGMYAPCIMHVWSHNYKLGSGHVFSFLSFFFHFFFFFLFFSLNFLVIGVLR
ncbi:hypothetical protein DFH27DRAFT_547437 [Peziza echinospora]|nr:hypothetical protein DFH27DRAFT_547437 [Peziza echinospora]